MSVKKPKININPEVSYGVWSPRSKPKSKTTNLFFANRGVFSGPVFISERPHERKEVSVVSPMSYMNGILSPPAELINRGSPSLAHGKQFNSTIDVTTPARESKITSDKFHTTDSDFFNSQVPYRNEPIVKAGVQRYNPELSTVLKDLIHTSMGMNQPGGEERCIENFLRQDATVSPNFRYDVNKATSLL